MKEIENIVFSSIYPFVCDEDKLINNTECTSVELLKNEVDDLMPYVTNIFNKKDGHLSYYQRSINKNESYIFIKIKNTIHRITTKKVSYFILNDFALCIIDYSVDNISIDDAVMIHYALNHIAGGNDAEFYNYSKNISVDNNEVKECSYKNNEEFKIYSNKTNNTMNIEHKSKTDNYFDLLKAKNIDNYCEINKIEKAIEELKIGNIHNLLNKFTKDIAKSIDKIEGNSNLYSYTTAKMIPSVTQEKIDILVSNLLQYRKRLDETISYILSDEYIRLQTNITIYGTEHCIINIGIDNDSEFMKSSYIYVYSKYYFLVYLVALIQNLNLQYLIMETVTNKNIDDIDILRKKVINFLADVNFNKITNNRNRKLMYSFIRKQFSINELTLEAKESIMLMNSKIKEEETERDEKRARKKEKVITIAGAIIGVSQLDNFFNMELSITIKIVIIFIVALFLWVI